jgi:hypothetical protein
MIARFKEAYKKYTPYIRVDAVMYLVLILLIVGYFIYGTMVRE